MLGPHALRPDRRKRSGIRSATRKPLAVGLNCALGAASCARMSRSSRASPIRYVCAYPNAGLPNAFGEYDETPQETARDPRRIRAQRASSISSAAAAARRPSTSGDRATRVEDVTPRRADAGDRAEAAGSRGLEPLNIDRTTRLFVNIGERTNVTGSAKFRKLIEAGDYAAALGRAPAGRERRADDRRQHGRGHARFGSGDGAVPAI